MQRFTGAGVGVARAHMPPVGGASAPAGGAPYDGKIAGLYDLEETLGRGHFAVVKLARHVFTGEKVAVKVIDKTKLDEVSRAHLFQEVRCMKLVQHPNVVRLYEVIDTQTKLYLILELGDGGDLYDYIMRHESGLSEHLARDYFRQIVRAISYCHRLHVVHRDLKPENVVFFEKLGVVKLTDFGFSNRFCPGQKLETSCGSLAYSAPEILLGDSYDAPAVDVWSLGVILYMLVCGQAPFQEANDSETLTMIMDCKYTIPQHVSRACKNLIGRMLIREPEKRATLEQIAADPWLLEGAGATAQLQEHLPLISRHQVSDEDHAIIIQKMVNGNIATKEQILEALDKNEYNHITATYFLLAERKLRAVRLDSGGPRRPEHLSVKAGNSLGTQSNNTATNNNSEITGSTMLTVPRTPGDLPQRARKCSIVQEEDDEEDLSSCSGREELAPPHCSLNRRGSRSEGKLNVTVQERLAESERRREHKPPPPVVKHVLRSTKLLNKSTPPIAPIKHSLFDKLANRRLENTSKPPIVSNRISVNAPTINNTAKSPVKRPGSVYDGSTPLVILDNDSSKSPVILEDVNNSMNLPVMKPDAVNNSPKPPVIFSMDNKRPATINVNTALMNNSAKSPKRVTQVNEKTMESVSTGSKPPVIFDIDNKRPNSVSLNTTPLNSGTKLIPKSPIVTIISQSDAPVINVPKSPTNKRPVSAIEPQNSSIVTTIITESSTITIPIHTTTKLSPQALPKYKTMPSPTRSTPAVTLCPPQLTLNEIFEESDTQQPTRQFVSRHQTRANYDQRKSKFKNRTASCSSSDASDDDSESRKKRAHKLNTNGKPLPRRDSHDDSSDSQDPGCGTGGGASQGGPLSGGGVSQGHISDRQYTENKTTDTRNGNNTGGRKNCDSGKENNVSVGRKHRTGRRRTGETRLRESQSLNRISEVQEDVHTNSNLVITLTAASLPPPKHKNIGSRLLHGWKKHSPVDEIKSPELEEAKIEKDKALTEKSGRRMRLLGKYFQVHKKICIPIPGLFSRNRLHKTQSCSSLVRDRITIDSSLFSNEIMKNGEVKKSDINQNLGTKSAGAVRNGTVVQLNTMCSGIGMCTLHLGDASKCCSLC